MDQRQKGAGGRPAFNELTGTAESLKSFDQAFSKACEVKGAEPLSRSAERETLLSAFLFVNFFFAPFSRKEKVANDFVLFNELLL